MNIDSNKVLEWMEDNVEDCFVIGDNGVYHLDTFLLEDKYKVFVDQATENEDKVSIKVWSIQEKEEFKEDVNTLIKLVVDDTCIGNYVPELLDRIKQKLNNI
jgi:hypothetical protein